MPEPRESLLRRGTYIGFVDSDDWIDNDMYENLMDAVEDF